LWSLTKDLILKEMNDSKLKSHGDMMEATSFSRSVVWSALNRYLKKGLILRTKEPLLESEKIFKGRAGVNRSTRAFHLCILKPQGVEPVRLRGKEFKLEILPY